MSSSSTSSMEQQQQQDSSTQTMIPTFLTSNKPAGDKSLHVFRRSRRRLSKEVTVMKKQDEDDEDEEKEEQEEDDREEIEKKIHALQKIVPGGESFGVDKLFDETAGYILALQYQVKALRALTGFFEKLEKEKTKFGG